MTTKTYFSVKYMEVDGMGIVHHANYPLWFEKARRDFLRRAGASRSHMADRGLFLPLSEIECKYKSPARCDDEIMVVTKVLSLSCVKIMFEYEVFNNKNGKFLATGKTVHAWTDKRVVPVNIEKAAPDIYLRVKQFYEAKEST